MKIEVYGTGWCPKTQEIKDYLNSELLDFDFFNVETDPEAAERVKKLYNGQLKFPTLIIGGDHLKNPKTEEIEHLLKQKGLLD